MPLSWSTAVFAYNALYGINDDIINVEQQSRFLVKRGKMSSRDEKQTFLICVISCFNKNIVVSNNNITFQTYKKFQK